MLKKFEPGDRPCKVTARYGSVCIDGWRWRDFILLNYRVRQSEEADSRALWCEWSRLRRRVSGSRKPVKRSLLGYRQRCTKKAPGTSEGAGSVCRLGGALAGKYKMADSTRAMCRWTFGRDLKWSLEARFLSVITEGAGTRAMWPDCRTERAGSGCPRTGNSSVGVQVCGCSRRTPSQSSPKSAHR